VPRSKKAKATDNVYRGVKYKSWLEVTVAKQLHTEGIEVVYEDPRSVINFWYEIPNAFCRSCGEPDCIREATYLPDWSPGKVVLEAKGKLDVTQRRKFLALRKSRPDLDIRFIFQRDNWITTAKKTTYTQWAEKYGFPSCVLTIPPTWFKEMKQ
jgi:hypothetical protein